MIDPVELLKQTQAKAGLSQRKFASSLDISDTLLNMIYAGKRNCTLRLLRRLASRYPETTQTVIQIFTSQEN